jgi:hypothetical protein
MIRICSDEGSLSGGGEFLPAGSDAGAEQLKSGVEQVMNPPGWENADTCAQLRTRAGQMAARRWTEAMEIATSIPLPWYRVQAIASVAQVAPEENVDELLANARDEAQRDGDAYRQTAVLAWIIRAARVRDRDEFARRLFAEALSKMEVVTPDKSRAAALELLLAEAVLLGDREARQAGEALLEVAITLSADPIGKWRRWGRSYINRTASLLSKRDRTLAETLLEARLSAEQAAAVLSRHG